MVISFPFFVCPTWDLSYYPNKEGTAITRFGGMSHLLHPLRRLLSCPQCRMLTGKMARGLVESIHKKA